MAYTVESILAELRSLSSEKNRHDMARFGINVNKAYGVPIPPIRNLAKKIGRDHTLAQQMWSTGVHEARLLACFIDEPEKVTDKQMERWARDFDSWDLCDQVCNTLFDQTPFAYRKVAQWSARPQEFVKRAAFSLMASLAVHDAKAPDSTFEAFLPLIAREAPDERNFVKKAVNWALRQIGKRNARLRKLAIQTAKEIQKLNSRSAKWVASDALRELAKK